MHDALMDVLRGMRLSGAVFPDAEFTHPWCTVVRAVRARQADAGAGA